MSRLQRLPGFVRSPRGLEWVILRRLPWAAAGCTAVPALMVLFAHGFPPALPPPEAHKYLGMVEIIAVSLAVTGWTAIFTVAIGCVAVWIMKGPAYVADRYELEDADTPVGDEPNENGQPGGGKRGS